MELSRNSVPVTRKRTGLGRCRHFFWLGVAFDTAGATVLFTGVFAHLVFSDLLLYLGSIIIFLSLLWWVFWYTGNIELPAEESSKRPVRVLSSTLVAALSRTVGHRFSLSICNVSDPLRRFQRRCSRKRFLRTAALDMTVTGQLESRLEKEDQDKDATKSVREGGDAHDLRREHLGPKPEPVGSSEGVRPPGPEAGLPEGSSSTHLGPPDFDASPPDRPRAPGVLPYGILHVVPLTSACQPRAVRSSGSQPAVTLASAGQPAASLASSSPPAIILASESRAAVPSTSMRQPALVLDSQGQPLGPAATQDHPLGPAFAQSNLQALLKASQSCPRVSASTQSHPQAALASGSQLEKVSLDSQTPSPGDGAAQAQAPSTPVFLIQLLSPQSFQSQTVDLPLSPAIPDFQTLCHTPQVPQSAVSLVQEVTPSQSASGQESQKPVAQSSVTPPPASQELSQEPPTTASPPPRVPGPAVSVP